MTNYDPTGDDALDNKGWEAAETEAAPPAERTQDNNTWNELRQEGRINELELFCRQYKAQRDQLLAALRATARCLSWIDNPSTAELEAMNDAHAALAAAEGRAQ